MLHQIIPFVIKHWELASAFVAVTLLILFEEMKSKNERGEQLSPAAAVHLINREDAIVIDLRDASAFREGHIVNAKNIALADFNLQEEKLKIYRERPVILVDAMGLKITPIVLRLKKAEFKKVMTLKGGIDAWKTAGFPLARK